MKSVYIILGKDVSKEIVKQELVEEGYKYYFYFQTKDDDHKEYHMTKADEIWVFGDVTENEDSILAQNLGLDIWVMG